MNVLIEKTKILSYGYTSYHPDMLKEQFVITIPTWPLLNGEPYMKNQVSYKDKKITPMTTPELQEKESEKIVDKMIAEEQPLTLKRIAREFLIEQGTLNPDGTLNDI